MGEASRQVTSCALRGGAVKVSKKLKPWPGSLCLCPPGLQPLIRGCPQGSGQPSLGRGVGLGQAPSAPPAVLRPESALGLPVAQKPSWQACRGRAGLPRLSWPGGQGTPQPAAAQPRSATGRDATPIRATHGQWPVLSHSSGGLGGVGGSRAT